MSEPSDPVSPTTSHHSAPISVTTPPSSFPSKAPLVHHLPALKAELNQVATARGNVYAKKMGIIIRWDGDNTGAEEDAITMSRVMDTFNIQCTHHILKTSDPIPGWTLTDKIRKMILDCCNSKLNSLFVVYYAGHGTIVDGNLYFAMGEKLVSWSKIRADLNSYEDTDAMRRIDVLGVLDCCYSGAATRAQNSRTFQVIAVSSQSPLCSRIALSPQASLAFQHMSIRSQTDPIWSQPSPRSPPCTRKLQKCDPRPTG